MKYILSNIFLFFCIIVIAQDKKIQLLNADNTLKNEEKYPGAIVALDNVTLEHEGARLYCQQALLYPELNFVKAFGNVLINQGDTITQTSKYVDYDGNTKKTLSWGDVVLKNPSMTLTTDTLYFDRAKQELYYQDYATIRDSINVLNSKIGFYELETNKFKALSRVTVTNLKDTLHSEHLDYYTNTAQAYLYGPSTITSQENLIYCERGFYDTKTQISYFKQNAKIFYRDRIIQGDSLYYNENIEFASATGNIIVTDTINDSIIKGGYAELFKDKDSVFVIKKAVAISLIEKDSLYIHGDTLLITGPKENRLIRAYHHAKFFKTDLKGKCDSIVSDESTGITELFTNPVVWAEENQITGDTIYLLYSPKTEKMDSLKVISNAFVISKDSSGYNQMKGKRMLGKFVDDKLKYMNVIGNSEVVNYIRDQDSVLIGVLIKKSSQINFVLDNSEIETITFMTKPSGKTYPLSQLPENLKILKGFIWRESEKPLTKEDVFKKD